MWNIGEIKEEVIRRTVKGLVEYLNIDEKRAIELVEKACIEQMVEEAPDLMLHYSKEQLIYDVLR